MSEGPLDFGPPDPRERETAPPPREERPPREARDLRHREDPDLHTLPASRPRARFGPGAIGGAALLLFVVFVSASVLLDRKDGPGARGLEAGARAPAFSAPLVDGPTKDTFEVNVLKKRDGKNPAACDVRGPNAVNACALWRRGPVVVTFFTAGQASCVQEVDLIERLRPQYPKVRFVAISLGDERDRTRRLKRDRGWGLPVGYDLSGALSATFGVAVCPHLTFVRRGGEVAGTDVGELDERSLRAALDALVAGRDVPAA